MSIKRRIERGFAASGEEPVFRLPGRAGISLTFNPGPPVPMMYFENGVPVPVAGSAGIIDESPDFDAGTLTVSLTGATAFDQLGVRNQGNGADQIGVSGNQILYGGVVIGSFTGGANGTNLVATFTGAAATPDAARALVRNIVFSNTNEALQSGGKSFTLVLTDGDGESAQIQTNVQAFGVNDAPVLANLDPGTIQYQGNSPPQRLDAGLDTSVSDVDSPDFSGGSLTVSITAGKVTSEDVLGFDTSASVTLAGNTVSVGGVSIGTVSGGGAGASDLVFSFNAGATLTRVSELLRHLTYRDSSPTPTLGTRTLSITLKDGDGGGFGGGVDTVSVALDVRVVPGGPPPTGQPPSFTLPNHFPLQYFENSAFPVQIAREALLSDPDSPNFGGGSLNVSMVDATAADQIGIGSGEGISRSGDNVLFNGVVIGTVSGGVNGSTLLVSFNANATPAAAQMLVKYVTYRTLSDAPVDGLVTFTLVVNDGSGNLGQISSTVDVEPINDAPILASLYGDFSVFTTGGPPIRVDAGALATASDIDSSAFGPGGLQVSITGGLSGSGDQLGLLTGSGVTMSGGSILVDGVVIGTVLSAGGANGIDLRFLFNGNATHARVSKLIQSVTYWNSEAVPTDSLKTITFTLEDSGGTNFGGVSTTLAAAQVQVGQPAIPSNFTAGSALTTDLLLTADGSRIFEATDDGFIRVYDAGTGAFIASWDVGNRLGAIDLSPDGTYLMAVERQLVGQSGGTSTVAAYRVDVATGAVTSYQTVVPGDNGAFWEVAILADGRVFFPGTFAGSQQVTPRILDLSTGSFTASTSYYGNAPLVAMSEDRSLVLLAGAQSSSAPLYLVAVGADGQVVTSASSQLNGNGGFAHGFAAAGLAAGYIAQHADGTYLYDLALGNRIQINQNSTLFDNAGVVGLAFDPDGEFLFVLDHENDNIRQVSLADFSVVRTIAVGLDVSRFWSPGGVPAYYADRLQITDDLGRFTVATGSAIRRLDAAMPSLNLLGGAGGDELIGSIGDDVLNGAGGADVLAGNHGDDLYFLDHAGDLIVGETHHRGNDRVAASVSYALTADAWIEQLETISLAGTNAIDLGGSSIANIVRGNNGINILRGEGGNDTLFGYGGNDFLVGGAGADVMVGGAGDDTYYIDDTSDAIGELAGEGLDRIAATITLALAADADIERIDVVNLTSTNAIDLTGSGIANVIYGNDGTNILRGEAGNDELRGFGGNDFLVGGTGTDLMVGGAGDDTFYVDDASDAIGEIDGEGNDRIAASVSFVLSNGANVELLEAVNLLATTAFDLTGSDSNNTITGNNGVNILRGEGGNDSLSGAGGDDFLVGGAGIDAMVGGAGNDTYYVDNAADTVFEVAGEGGNDRVAASVSYALAANADVERLEADPDTGSGALELAGSESNNAITGNNGANVLDGKGGNDVLFGAGGDDFLVGGSGVDSMTGGAGNDTYYVDDAADAVIETAGEGSNDRVATSVSYALAANAEIERLEAANSAGTGAIDLTGSTSGNAITGNDGANTLNGGNGGNDVLTGLGGTDVFAFTTALAPTNADVIADFASGNDRIALDDAVFVGLTTGALNPGAFVIGTVAADADDRIIYDQATGRLFFDADGNGAGGAALFATLSGNPALAASDFTII